MSAAREYLRTSSDAMHDRYAGDCLKQARRIAELLREEGKSPWIGRIRDEVPFGDSFYRHPLIPRRFVGVTWETHYVACCDGEAYDPIIGEPIAIESYTEVVFGKRLAIEPIPPVP